MNPELMRNYLAKQPITRRKALGLGAAGAAVMSTLGSEAVVDGRRPARTRATQTTPAFTDDVFDYADPANLDDWVPSRYGAGDQRGALGEVTPDVTARALHTLRGRGRGVTTYNLGELMANGVPAFVTSPPRFYEQRLTLLGYEPPSNFEGEGGILQSPTPLGSNQISVHEERFECVEAPPFRPLSVTYQIGTQLDNLNHVGAGAFFYNGFLGPDIAHGWGTSSLGAEQMGPVVTRGVLLDVLGEKLASGQTDALGPPAANGRPVLADTYRITIDDLEAATDFGNIRSLKAGDAIMIRTGWNQLLARTDRQYDPGDIARWGAAGGMPGIYLAEARWLGTIRPAVVGSDTWALEALGSSDNDPTAAFPVHQELIMRHGIRIAESLVLDALAEDGVYEYVHIVTPQFAEGATAGNTPPAALGIPRHH